MKRNLLSLLVLISMLAALVSSVAASPATAAEVQSQTPQQTSQPLVVKVGYSTHDEINYLASRYDVTEVDQKNGIAYLLVSADEMTAIQQAGYRAEVDGAKTKLINQPHLALPGQGPDSIPGYPCYRTVEETYTTLQNIVADHPEMAEEFDIGDTWDKVMHGEGHGYNIYALRLTNENFGVIDEKPTFFLMAEIHAREYATAELATRYAEYLINNYNVDPDVTWLLNYFRVFIVTMTNPDGRKLAEQGQMWRKNIDNDDGCTDPSSWGTDLNRNYAFKWAYDNWGSDPYACGETYRGPAAASEPETQAIQNFVSSIFADQRGPGDTDPAPLDANGMFLTLHSAAALVLWPWGYVGTDSPNATQLQTLGRHLAFYNGYTPQQSNDLYATNGTTDDWSYGTLGIASYTFEMAGQFFQDCGAFNNTDVPDNLNSLVYAFKSARRPYMNPAGPDTENITALPAAVAPGDTVQLSATANDTHYAGGETTHNIAAAHYSIDNPSWVPGTTTYDMSPTDGSFNSKIEGIEATIDTTGLTSGRHTIFIESKDANNNWGVTGSTFLYIIEPGVSPVIEGYVLAAGTNQPLTANVKAGLFSTTSDPATGFYSMTVVSGTYDMVVDTDNFAPAYAYDVVAQDYQVVQRDFHLYPVCSIFTDDVETGNLGWTADSPWAITTEASHSPTHSWTDSPGGNYGDYRNVSLTSQEFDLTSATGVTLNFWHEYVTEAGWDYGYVEYNDGSGWNSVTSYDGNSQGWNQVELPIPGLDGKATARLRFHFTSDSNTNYDGWHIDDISLTAGGPGCMPPAAPTAGFSSNSPVPLGTPMEFTNETVGSEPMTYLWDFGDGVGTSDDINPSYVYTEVGTYTVTLTATNNLGSDTISQPVSVDLAPITGLSLVKVTPGTIYPGDQVEFSADISPDTAAKPYDYMVDYGDGTIASGSSDLDPLLLSHAYSLEGNYTVQVSVQNAVMQDPVNASVDIAVAPTPTAPVADFDTNSPVKLGNPILFTNLTSGTLPITYQWDFGDGVGTSSDTNPSYTYSAPGIYTVILTATNPWYTDTITKTVTVLPLHFWIFLPLASK